MQGNKLLEQYEQLNYVVEQMLINAHDEHWESLVSWQAKYQQLSENLIITGDFTRIDTLPKQHRDIIQMYIKNILSYQQQLTQLIITRHAQLRKMIGEHVDYQNKIDNYQEVARLM
jgi:hypothetical protein